jgi:hypothetical protein
MIQQCHDTHASSQATEYSLVLACGVRVAISVPNILLVCQYYWICIEEDLHLPSRYSAASKVISFFGELLSPNIDKLKGYTHRRDEAVRKVVRKYCTQIEPCQVTLP